METPVAIGELASDLEEPVLSFTTPVKEGDPVTLSCDVVAKPDGMFTFKKDGSVLEQGGSSTYTFTTDRNDQGSYMCEVENDAGTKATAGQVLDVYFAPEITALEDIEVSRGENVVISFDVEARPAANYDWSSQGATDIDSDPETFTFVASNTIGDVYTVTLNASNEVGARQSSVQVTVVARTTTLITTNAFTTQPDSCGSLSIVNDGKKVDGNMNVEVGDEVSLRCQCGDSDEGFEYEWTLDGDKMSESTLIFTAEKNGHEVVCIGTAGAPEPSSVSINVLVTDKEPSTGEGGIGTGAIAGIVVGILVMLIILAVVIIIVLKSRDDGPSKSADSAYMDVTWDTKDPNRVNQGKKTAPPSNGTKEAAKSNQVNYINVKPYGMNYRRPADKTHNSGRPSYIRKHQDAYHPYDASDDRAYSRPSYGSEDYNDRPDDDDYANSMPVTV
ncbi:cell adhesion molecule CEACAM1-like [Antedon mediterranea]|uniref:cell adhesion molecule CEACAM1-like n=1 Tax=Antedon mediterranea TaxID=105859 RepID=UPI003AF89625